MSQNFDQNFWQNVTFYFYHKYVQLPSKLAEFESPSCNSLKAIQYLHPKYTNDKRCIR